MGDPTSGVGTDLWANGVRIPNFIYGTAWKENETERLTALAIATGFTGVDTANQRRHYHEAGVGAGLARAYSAGRIQRQDLFLQTKFTYQAGQDHRLPYDPKADFATQVNQSFESSLKHLHTDYLDSYVLHGPSVGTGLSNADWEVWGAMEALVQEGKTKLLGVSNVNLGQLQTLVSKASVRPAVVQNRCFSKLGWDKDVRAFCRDHEILYQGFSLLTANPEVFKHSGVQQIARQVQRTPIQVVFRFSHRVGMIALTGTTNPNHMREDLMADDFDLTNDDIRVIEEAGLHS